MAQKKKSKTVVNKQPRRTRPTWVGVIHLPALPGAPSREPADKLMDRAGAWALDEAKVLERSGCEALIIENFGDVPFYKSDVPAETIASMAVIHSAVQSYVKIPVGVNTLRNAGRASLGIAAATGAAFYRVNVLSGIAATDQGLIESEAAILLREQARLGVSAEIWADFLVKHAVTLSTQNIELAIEEVALRGGASRVIATGATTGRAISVEELKVASHAARALRTPLMIGSGTSVENLRDLAPWVDGFIVGSTFRKGGQAAQPIDPKRLRDFVKAVRAL